MAILLLTGCGSDDSAGESANSAAAPSDVGSVIDVSLDEYVISMPTELPAGPTTLAIVNDGSENHQLTIVAADSYESLPSRENGSVQLEELDTGTVVLATESLFAGFPATEFDVDLETGSYVLFCNIQSFTGEKSHAGLGQRLLVTVS